jgi:hypothetical protein
VFNAPLKEFNYKPEKIKITLWNYTFTSIQEYEKTRNYWNKKYIKDFLRDIDSDMLMSIFQKYSLPNIDVNRIIRINPFQQIPVIDLVIIVMIIIFFGDK